MATETGQNVQTSEASARWGAGIVGGIAGALVMGVLMLAMNSAVVAVAIPSLYALAPPPNPVVGLAVHVFHGAVLGAVFAGIVSALDFESTGELVGLGIAWGFVTWVALAALLMPVWLSAVGSPASPPFPNFALPSALWHVVYGVVLGGVFAATKRRF